MTCAAGLSRDKLAAVREPFSWVLTEKGEETKRIESTVEILAQDSLMGS